MNNIQFVIYNTEDEEKVVRWTLRVFPILKIYKTFTFVWPGDLNLSGLSICSTYNLLTTYLFNRDFLDTLLNSTSNNLQVRKNLKWRIVHSPYFKWYHPCEVTHSPLVEGVTTLQNSFFLDIFLYNLCYAFNKKQNKQTNKKLILFNTKGRGKAEKELE